MVVEHASTERHSNSAAICRHWRNGWRRQHDAHAHPHQITYPRAPLFSSLNSCCSIPDPHVPHMGFSRLSDPMDRTPSGTTRSRQRHDHHQRRFLFLLGGISPVAGGNHSRVSRSSGAHHTSRPPSGCSFSVVPRSLHPSSRIHTASHGDVVKRRSINRHGEAEVHPLRNCTGNA